MENLKGGEEGKRYVINSLQEQEGRLLKCFSIPISYLRRGSRGIRESSIKVNREEKPS